MSEESPPPSAPPPTPDPPAFKAPESQADLDRIIEQRLARERSKFGDYDDLKKKAQELDKLREGEKSELQKAQDAAAEAAKRAEAAEARALRHEVAAAKGLTPAQAKRLAGATKEELEADADEILRDFPTAATPPPSQQPRPTLRGGGDPSSEPGETDPAKLAASVPRL